MILFLRTNERDTVAEVSFYIKDDYLELRPTIYIREYSYMLLTTSPDKQDELVDDFEQIQRLRGWLWEQSEFNTNYSQRIDINKRYELALGELRGLLKAFASKYKLYYVED